MSRKSCSREKLYAARTSSTLSNGMSTRLRFASANMHTGDQFFHYLRDTFDVLYAEGEQWPKMMSVGLHCRLVGRPGKMAGLERFLKHAAAHKDVWFCRRIEIARHWRETHPCDR